MSWLWWERVRGERKVGKGGEREGGKVGGREDARGGKWVGERMREGKGGWERCRGGNLCRREDIEENVREKNACLREDEGRKVGKGRKEEREEG